MPVVIPEEAFDLWLDCRNIDALTAAALLVPAPEDLFEAYEISTAVNRVANDSPELIRPVARSAPDVHPEPNQTVAATAPVKRGRKPKKDERQSSLF
jgi:hypothetical protein